jgi:hypothetical protein
LVEERHLKPGRISEQLMCGVRHCFVYQRDRTTLSSNPVIALTAYHHPLTGLCPCNLDVFGNDTLKRILGDRNLKRKEAAPETS